MFGVKKIPVLAETPDTWNLLYVLLEMTPIFINVTAALKRRTVTRVVSISFLLILLCPHHTRVSGLKSSCKPNFQTLQLRLHASPSQCSLVVSTPCFWCCQKYY